MKSRLSIVTLVAAFSLSMLPLNQVAAQDDNRGMRVQQASPTERRVALVIGNSAYKDSPLLNPVNDARDMAAALRGLGFEVIFGENLSQTDMKRNIRAFGEKIRNGGVGLFYYAGHGIQVRGSNYLVPVGANITNEEEVEYESVDVGLVLAQMENARNRLNIVILDACRNNPFARSFRSTQKGLASIDAPGGTLLAYATAPGSVASDGGGRNGLYTQELLKYIKQPELSIEQLFKQVRASVRSRTEGKQIPWESSSLEGDFYFSASEIASNTTKNNPPPTFDPAMAELSFWESIKNSADMEDYKAYLEKYPLGTFVALARNKLRSLEASAKPPETNTSVPVERSTDVDANWLLGLWEGTGHQTTINATWTIRLRVQNGKYSIEYPSLSCGGEWILLEKTLKTMKFSEKITNGSARCADNGYVIIERMAPSQVLFNYIDPGTTVVMASAILKKK